MIHGILLAAGTSSRMGQPKQLLPWHGQPLVRHIAGMALASRLAGLTVVLGAAASQVHAALGDLERQVVCVECIEYATGMASSLRCGIAALPMTATATVVLLVDQPLVSPGLINQLITTFEADPQVLAIVPRYQGQRGNPVLIAAGLFDELRTLEGDSGARAILAAHTSQVRWLDLDDPAVCMDVDTPTAYRALGKALPPNASS